MIEALLYGKLNDVTSDKEVSTKAFLFDDVQLLLDAAVSGLVGGSIAVEHPLKGFLAQQFQIVIDIARESALVFYTIVQVDFALFQDILCVFNKLRIECESGFQPFWRQENLIGSVKAGNQHILIDGTHTLMQLEIISIGEGDRLHSDQLFKGCAVVQFGQLGEAHAKELVLFQLCRFPFPERIDYEDVFPIRRDFRIRLFAEVMLCQETIQFGKARVVFGQSDI